MNRLLISLTLAFLFTTDATASDKDVAQCAVMVTIYSDSREEGQAILLEADDKEIAQFAVDEFTDAYNNSVNQNPAEFNSLVNMATESCTKIGIDLNGYKDVELQMQAAAKAFQQQNLTNLS